MNEKSSGGIMSYYDYKVIPAPRRSRRVKGIHAASDLFALTLTETINEIARQGWEFMRAELMAAEAPKGWFRRAVVAEETVLVFRRPREHLSPRLAAVPDSGLDAELPRVFPDRSPQGPVLRREPVARLEPRDNDDVASGATPLRTTPRLGPAEKT